jgi:hypothetical protein
MRFVHTIYFCDLRTQLSLADIKLPQNITLCVHPLRLMGKNLGFATSGVAHLRNLQICDGKNEPKNLRIFDLRD